MRNVDFSTETGLFDGQDSWQDGRMRTPRRLREAYRVPGFRPAPTVVGIFGDPKARVIRRQRRGKKRHAERAASRAPGTTARHAAFATCPAGTRGSTWRWGFVASSARRCGTVKQENVGLAGGQSVLHQRVAFFVGRRCRTMTVKDVAEETSLDWQTVKELDKQYMREQLRRAGTPAPKVIGIDEISIRKGHTYRIVVSDLERRRPIWFGGKDRSEASMDAFYQWLGSSKSKKIRLAVMDMWKAFRNSTLKPEHAPQAAILFDKFHVLRHLGEALDTVRKAEYCPSDGQGSAVHQGPEVHAAVALGEPDSRMAGGACGCCSRPTSG